MFKFYFLTKLGMTWGSEITKPVEDKDKEAIKEVGWKKMFDDVIKFLDDNAPVINGEKTMENTTLTEKDKKDWVKQVDVILDKGNLWSGVTVFKEYLDWHYSKYSILDLHWNWATWGKILNTIEWKMIPWKIEGTSVIGPGIKKEKIKIQNDEELKSLIMPINERVDDIKMDKEGHRAQKIKEMQSLSDSWTSEDIDREYAEKLAAV